MSTTNNQYQALSTLEGIDPTDCRKVMSNYDSFMNRVQRKIIMQPFINHIKSAEKSYRKEDEVREKKSLIRAMNIIGSDKITDEDFIEEDLRDYVTGTLLTSEKIKMRLQTLGKKES